MNLTAARPLLATRMLHPPAHLSFMHLQLYVRPPGSAAGCMLGWDGQDHCRSHS